ncbi:MAG: CRISPR-associated endonuclease Cas1 [Methanomicrobiales archaeon]|nr:CRISPR-associated endonuclease Cas1 [Methanomicrobiales archaeon]MDI6876743.1 CRISPR-associated endonuclease Cas1 [Methanomicrobiales archaeon]
MDRPPWLVVHGYGSHIKTTQSQLIIQRGGTLERYPLGSVQHLLVLGGHTIHSAAIATLLKGGASITFFDPDGTPLGMLHRYGERPQERIRSAQQSSPGRKYAIAIATAAIRVRIMLVEQLAEAANEPLLFEGESLLLHQAQQELEYLVRMEEVRRLYRLTADMYYEIMARTLPPELGFRRRTERPHRDPVNALLSLGYAVLFGACSVAVHGAHLDPDLGMLHEGAAGLIHDIAETLKPRMVDTAVFAMARNGLDPDTYECTEKRCHLSHDLAGRLIGALHESVRQDEIDDCVNSLRESLLYGTPFRISS